ncbi:hypothetical protein JN06_01390 [Bacteroides zoogleoformans]|uniref:Uncharacterized protein n=1 Tax=Bacteroides zoogleoformans TaxID=28119 RepID=A0ABN5IKM4_9BACE|nr:hypothetical protein [Bacteroides zoogleoformans]AVM53352.1 hypothetical protein C4H11_10780 [Bacteroides zoogleoformans]TWJ14457.1 hypothetical protein JN06_01390 [Bacteroides zoogleoformans]
MNIFNRIQELADIKGVTMYVISQDTGISESVFSRLKKKSNASIGKKNLLILANYFCVNEHWLATGEGEREAPGVTKDVVIHDDGVWERIEHLSMRLFSEDNTLSSVDFEKMSRAVNIHPKRLRDIIDDKKYPTYTELKSILQSKDLNINSGWIMTGDGKVFNDKQDCPIIIETEEEYKRAIEMGLRILPEVSFEFAGGSTELINLTENTKRFWYLPDSTDCDGVATISGNSMAPAYPSGCQVALKKVGFNPQFPLDIPFGQVFGVVVENEATGLYHGHIKILRKYPEPEKEKEYWIARSIDRDNYDDFYIKISSVRGLWIVKQHIVQDVIL